MKKIIHFILMLTLACFLISPLMSFGLTAREVYAKVHGSIYTLYSFDYDTRRVKARGSAVAIGKTVLATNCHVALSGNYLVVKIDDKPRVARLFYKNEQKDLCLLEVPKASFNPVKIRGSEAVDIGEVVYAIGNPKGTEKTISKGIISNKHKVRGGVWLQTDAAIYYGSSGGGLFDESGNLIGITTKMGGNFGFAIPTEWISTVLRSGSSSSSRVAKNVNEDTKSEITVKNSDDEDATPSVVKKEQPKEKSSSVAHKGLVYLGTFGRNEVGLYRNNRECFLLIPGANPSGKTMSVVLWNPRYPRTIVIFPTVTTAKEAMEVIYKAVVDKRSKTLTSYKSDSVLILEDLSYNLYGTKADDEKYPFFVARFNKSPKETLERLQQFVVDFKDPDFRIGNSKITYDMDGFDDAMKSYNARCSVGNGQE